jgi:MYXO-CTERM domain-containing protein
LTFGGDATLTFTSSAAVAAFLPAKGRSGRLTGSHVDPLQTEAGVVAGQLTALHLNLILNEDLGRHLGNVEIPEGAFLGLDVSTFSDLATLALGGDTSVLDPYGAGFNDVNATAALINGEGGDVCDRVPDAVPSSEGGVTPLLVVPIDRAGTADTAGNLDRNDGSSSAAAGCRAAGPGTGDAGRYLAVGLAFAALLLQRRRRNYTTRG